MGKKRQKGKHKDIKNRQQKKTSHTPPHTSLIPIYYKFAANLHLFATTYITQWLEISRRLYYVSPCWYLWLIVYILPTIWCNIQKNSTQHFVHIVCKNARIHWVVVRPLERIVLHPSKQPTSSFCVITNSFFFYLFSTQ